MSLDLLCPEAQQMAYDRGLDLSQDVILQLAPMEPRRQTGWLHAPVIQCLIDRFMDQAMAGMGSMPAASDVSTSVPNCVLPVVSIPVVRTPSPEPDICSLFD
jgi:hypothetical protein